MKKAAIVLILCLLLCACGRVEKEAPELLEAVGSAPDTVQASYGDIEIMNVHKAVIAPNNERLFFTYSATIGEINMTAGAAVNKGDVIMSKDVSAINGAINALDNEEASIIAAQEDADRLFEIDTELYSLQLKKLEGDEKYALETEKEIYELTYSNDTTERNERLEAIKQERDALNAQLEGVSLVSPCNGRVVYLGVNAGQTIGAYEIACVVTNDDDLKLQSDMISTTELEEAEDVYALIGGERVEINLIPTDEDEYARAMLKGLTFYTDFSYPEDKNFVAGQTGVIITVNKAAENVLTIPVNALYSEDGEYYVYMMDGENRTRVSVAIGAQDASQVEITSGLEEGSTVYVGD